MRKRILVLAAGLVSLPALAADAPAPIPKEGSVSYVNVTSGTVKVLALGKEQAQVSYETMGVVTSPAGDGLLHNSSVRCMGGFHVVNGGWNDGSGSCIYTRLDGDQVFVTYKAAGKLAVPGKSPTTAKGTFTFVGGTGKLAGITGGGEWTRVSVRPAAEGTTQSVANYTGKYKLP